MKLLQISIEVNSGSVGRIAEHIGLQAINCGWESYITYARNNQPSKSKTIKVGNKIDVYWHGIMTRITDKHGFYSTLATKRLIKQINEINPDVILLHHLHGYFINIELLFNYLSKIEIPIVWIFHDCWSFTGHCTHFDFVGCEKWKNQCYACPQKKAYPSSFLVDNSRKNFALKRELFNSVKNMTIVPVSYWLGDLVKESFLRKYPFKVIQHGIDLNAFNITEYDDIQSKYNTKNKFVILGVASVWPTTKGLDDFIKLSQLLKEDEIVILVGLTKKQIKILPNNIIGIQRTESVEELAKFYSMADVYFNASVEETFGLTTVESFACGTPAIVYNKTAIPEVVDDEVGWVVEYGDFDSILKIISGLKSESKIITEERKVNCRKKAEKLHNREDRFKEYILLFNKLIDGN